MFCRLNNLKNWLMTDSLSARVKIMNSMPRLLMKRTLYSIILYLITYLKKAYKHSCSILQRQVVYWFTFLLLLNTGWFTSLTTEKVIAFSERLTSVFVNITLKKKKKKSLNRFHKFLLSNYIIFNQRLFCNLIQSKTLRDKT